MGQRVRYDGTDKQQPALFERIAPHAELIALCPEATLGIPRPPIHLLETRHGLRAIEVDNPTHDVTDHLHAFNNNQRAVLNTLCGVILKARSPSCGIGNAPVAGAAGTQRSGLFAGFIAREYPWIPMMDESALHDPHQAAWFVSNARLVCDAQLAISRQLFKEFLAHHTRTWETPRQPFCDLAQLRAYVIQQQQAASV
jgi:uncharacterized protein YbbK (DUF523 family)